MKLKPSDFALLSGSMGLVGLLVTVDATVALAFYTAFNLLLGLVLVWFDA